MFLDWQRQPYAPQRPARRPAGRRGDDLPGVDVGSGPERRRQHHARPGAASLGLASPRHATRAGSARHSNCWGIPTCSPRRRSSTGCRSARSATGRDCPGPGVRRQGDRLRRADQFAHATRRSKHLFHVIAGELREVRAWAVVYISHFLEEIREGADRYTVLRDGQTAGSGLLAAATEAEIVALMVGRSVDELFSHRAAHARRSDPGSGCAERFEDSAQRHLRAAPR